MMKWPLQAVSTVLSVVLPAMALLSALPGYAQGDPAPEEPEWLLNTMKDALTVADGDVLSFRHVLGDVRIKTADTDQVQVTAIAQYRADDPRLPKMRLVAGEAADGGAKHQLMIDFLALEIAENEAWAKRRIDVGLLVPKGLQVEVVTGEGLIEAKKIEARYVLESDSGDITYDGFGDLRATSKQGAVYAKVTRTGAPHRVDLSTLKSDIRCVFLAGASAQVEISTRGPITTDYSLKLDDGVSLPLKNGQVRIGDGGSKVHLESHSGGIRVQGLIPPETVEE